MSQLKSSINYDKLKIFNSASSLKPKEGEESYRHHVLMREFKTLFLPPVKPKPGIPNQLTKSFELSHSLLNRPKSRYAAYRGRIAPKDNTAPPTEFDDRSTHDVRYHIYRRRRKQNETDDKRVAEDLVLHREANLSQLRQLMKKQPFERSRKEHKKVYDLIRYLWPEELSAMLDDVKEAYPVLSELACVATTDSYKESGYTVFGNTGLHMVLKGSVRPQTIPYIRQGLTEDDDKDLFPCPTPLPNHKNVNKLTAGDWFGTLKKVEGREVNSKVLSAVTSEPCTLLKISIADYNRILVRIQQRVQNEKVQVVQSTFPYNKWPGLSIGKLAALIEWKKYPINSVIITEGEIAPYIAFVRKGDYDVFKQVEAVKTLPDGRKRRILKNVLMGRLGVGDSIGEHSIIEQKPVACTVVSSTDVEVGIILPYKLNELDTTMRTLLAQSVQPKFADIPEEEIQSRFIKQEMQNDWNQLKLKVLLQTINACGIRPGYGKWSNKLMQT